MLFMISGNEASRYGTIDKERVDSLELWSMILESDNVESWEVSKQYQD